MDGINKDLETTIQNMKEANANMEKALKKMGQIIEHVTDKAYRKGHDDGFGAGLTHADEHIIPEAVSEAETRAYRDGLNQVD